MKRILLYILLCLCSWSVALPQSAESDSLFARGVELFRAGKYKAALPLFSRVEKLDSAFFNLRDLPTDKYRNRAFYGQAWRAASLYRLGRKDEAFAICGEDAMEEPDDRALTHKIDEYIDLSVEAENAGRLQMARLYMDWVIEEEKKVFGDTYWGLGNSLMRKARLHSTDHEYEQAEQCALQALAVFKASGVKRGYVEPLVKHYRATAEMARNRFDEAFVLSREAFAGIRPHLRDAGDVYGDIVTLCLTLCQVKGTIQEYVDIATSVGTDCFDGKKLTVSMVYALWSAVMSLVEQQLYDPAIPLAEEGMKRVREDGLQNTLAGAYLGMAYARILNEIGRFEEALPLVENVIQTTQMLNCPDNMSLGQTYWTKGVAEFGLGRYEDALASARKAIVEFEKLAPYVDQGLWRSYSLKASAESKMKRYKDALVSLNKVRQALKKLGSQNWADWAYIASQESQIALDGGDVQAARDAIDEAIGYYRRIDGYTYLPQYYMTLMGKVSNGIASGREEEEALFSEILDRLKLDDDLTVAIGPQMKVQYAEYLFSHNRYEEAEHIFEELKNDGIELGDHRLAYAKLLLRHGKAAEAISVVDEYFDIIGQMYGSRKLYQARALTTAAQALSGELPSKSLRYARKAVEVLESEPWSTDKIMLMRQLASAYTNLSEADECMALADKCLQHLKADDYVAIGEMQQIRAGCLAALGRPRDGLQAVALARDSYTKGNITDVETLTECKFAEALCYEAEGLFGEALDALREGDKAWASLPDAPNRSASRVGVNTRIMNLATKAGRADMARAATDTIMRMMQTGFDQDNPMYAVAYLYKANQLAGEGRAEEGRRLLRSAVDRYARNSLDPNVETTLRQWFVNFLLSSGARREGLQYADSLIIRAREIGAQLHPGTLVELARAANILPEYDKTEKYLDLLHTPVAAAVHDPYLYVMEQALRAEAAMGRKQTDKGYASLIETYRATQKMVLDNFLTMSETERRDLWNSVLVLFRMNIPLAAAMSDYDPRFNALAYDASLFSTSLLLQSTKTVDEILSGEKDRKVRRLVKDFTQARTRYDDAATKAKTDLGAQTDVLESLRKDKEAAEKALLKVLKSKLGNYNAGLPVKWTDVRDALGSDEAAVEFVELAYNDTLRSYYALVLRPGYDAPHMLFLPFAGSLDFRSEECYTTEKVYENFWHPLADELKGCRRVWFAPQGQLTASAIEAVPGIGKVTGVEGTLFCRLTSTREIAVGKREKGRGAVLYGGIDYAAPTVGVRLSMNGGAPERDVRPNTSRASIFRDVDLRAISDDEARKLDGDSVRDVFVGIRPLPGTLDEMNAAVPILRGGKGQFSSDVKPLSGAKATESSLKALSGAGKRLLHIGTHGFYYDGTRTAWDKFFGDMQMAPEELAMHRSGLLFAGAQGPLCQGIRPPADMDDGVLTAAEIASLDFSGMELTVLSACETALGRISADGVFGLQRGFKQAGAGAILMSLWKVDDKATAALMTHFYSKWLEGTDKYAALESARRYVASQPGWSSPDYWAAFILVDGCR